MGISITEIKIETDRLYEKLNKLGWAREDCEYIAPTTLEINQLKVEQNAVILAHSYQTPDIMYGVGDYIGDSYGLSRMATEHPAQKIIFCSVYFMGETAKLLNPDKEVIVPRVAGCSLADSINAEQVRPLRQQYPHAGIACYVNSYAEVKAVSDSCCTSSNVVEVVEAMPQEEIVFIPDKLFGFFIYSEGISRTDDRTEAVIMVGKGEKVPHIQVGWSLSRNIRIKRHLSSAFRGK